MEVRDSARSVDASGSESGWITWQWEDSLYLVGWYQPAAGEVVRGVELDIPEVMNRLLPGVFAGLPEGTVYSLRNERDEIVFQDPASAPPVGEGLIRMPVGVMLPNWAVAAHILDGGVGGVPGQTLVLMSAVLLMFFIAAILLGGLALIRQAYQSRRDAVQKTTFVSSVTHELRTPLTSIRMYVDLLRGGADDDPDKRERYLGIIATESRRLARLVNNVLSFGRLERGLEAYTIESLDLGECMESILEKQRPRLEESGVRMVEQFNGASVPVMIDRDAFEQVVLNLIDNATKYAGNGGGSAEIEFVACETDDGAELRVMDRGAGIPEEHQERIFEQFQRVESSLSDGQKGTGLGLSISRRLMRDIGGDLYYESRAGGGSVFVIKLQTKDKAVQ
jgi:signal transduction histidine kinase